MWLCICLCTGSVFVTAIAHTWKTISNCDFEYCRLTNLCLNNCLFRIKVTHTKQLTKIKNRCAGTHTHAHMETHGKANRKRAREAYAGVRSLSTSIKRKQQQTAQYTHMYIHTRTHTSITCLDSGQGVAVLGSHCSCGCQAYACVHLYVFNLQLSLMYRVMCFKDIELRADSTDCRLFNWNASWAVIFQ